MVRLVTLAALGLATLAIASPLHSLDARDGKDGKDDKKNSTSNGGKGRLNDTSVLLPQYRGKPSDRNLEIKTGQNFVKIQARQKDSQSQDRYSFYFTTLGFPRFYSSYFNATASKGTGSANVTSWGYDMALLRLVEFEDKGELGFDDNDTVVSEFNFSGRNRNKGWSPIAFNKTTIENATVFSFGTVSGPRSF
jgi:hypothetical protein